MITTTAFLRIQFSSAIYLIRVYHNLLHIRKLSSCDTLRWIVGDVCDQWSTDHTRVQAELSDSASKSQAEQRIEEEGAVWCISSLYSHHEYRVDVRTASVTHS